MAHALSLVQLRAQLDAILPPPVGAAGARVGFGCADIDARLDGGLPQAMLHEVLAGSAEDWPAAAACALLLAARCGDGRAPILWLHDDRRGGGRLGTLYPPGLIELGIDPARLLSIAAPDGPAQLRAAADIARCRAAPALVIELAAPLAALDLTASRRLLLAAEDSGATLWLLQRDPRPRPSAAYSRWQVASAASTPLAANAPGPPTFALTMTRHRGGIAPFALTLEWNRDRFAFARPEPCPITDTAPAHPAPLPRPRPAVAGGRGMGMGLAQLWGGQRAA
jgi:protein ImuA